MPSPLQILAGPRARAHLLAHGLRPADVEILVGASGGPKWLVLHGLDRVLAEKVIPAARPGPLHLVGSSAGAWRHTALASPDPHAALERLREAYIGQRYPKGPSPRLVSETSLGVLRTILGPGGPAPLLANEKVRLHVLTNVGRGLLRRERRVALLAGLGLMALSNLASRRTQAWSMDRVAFHGGGDPGPLASLDDLPTRHAALTAENFEAVTLATGSIPLVLEGVEIPGGPPGLHRDGGVVDYHPALRFRSARAGGAGLVLYPHFFSALTPGWFDKSLPWRRAKGAVLDDVVLLAPSPEFVASLPGEKIPDRKDFETLGDGARQRAWREVARASAALGEALEEVLEKGVTPERVGKI
jgi:hypothetical protein